MLIIHFLNHLKVLGLIDTFNYSLSTTDSLLLLHFILVRSILEYASSVWKNITTTDDKLERIQRKFASLFRSFFPHVHYNDTSALELVKLQGGSNMTGTNCDLFTHNQSRSYLNHLVLYMSEGNILMLCFHSSFFF